MIDRGPDPLGVIAVTRTLPNVCVLKGNHEDLMLRALRGADQVEMSMCAMDWAMNGGSTTSDALEALDDEDASMVVDWVEQLPCWAQVRVGERLHPHARRHRPLARRGSRSVGRGLHRAAHGRTEAR